MYWNSDKVRSTFEDFDKCTKLHQNWPRMGNNEMFIQIIMFLPPREVAVCWNYFLKKHTLFVRFLQDFIVKTLPRFSRSARNMETWITWCWERANANICFMLVLVIFLIGIQELYVGPILPKLQRALSIICIGSISSLCEVVSSSTSIILLLSLL